MIRPEQITMVYGDANPTDPHPRAGAAHQATGLIKEVQFFGGFWRVSVQGYEGGARFLVDVLLQPGKAAPEVGGMAKLFWPPSSIHTITSTQT